MSSVVESPAGVRLLVGLVAPFLTSAGQREVEDFWGAPVDVLFDESVQMAGRVAKHPALHVALAAWVRQMRFPDDAARRLGALVQALPDGDGAQRLLDAWASDNTHGMIEKFPCTVDRSTKAVLASAIAVEDKWARRAKESSLVFGSTRAKGFTSTVVDEQADSTADRRTVRVRMGLASGLEMVFVISADGVEAAQRALASPEVFEVPVVDGQPFVSSFETHVETTDVSTRLPEFTIRSSHDLVAEAAKWGLVEVVQSDGIPGLGDLEVSQAAQSAFIEVTHTGVRAAAVTAMTLRAAGMWIPQKPYRQREVTFDAPFVYEMRMTGYPTALFRGVCDVDSVSGFGNGLY